MSARLQLITGRQVDLEELGPGDLDAEAIAHGLGHLCRFTGQVERYYSVAEHCWLASCLAPCELRLAALLHDAHEAFLGDVSAPLRKSCPGLRRDLEDLARRIDAQVARRWLRIGWETFHDQSLRVVDLRLRHTEAQQLLPGATAATWPAMANYPPYPEVRLRCWSPRVAAARWLDRLEELLLAEELGRRGQWYRPRWEGRALLRRLVANDGVAAVVARTPEHLRLQTLEALGWVRRAGRQLRVFDGAGHPQGEPRDLYLLTRAGCRAAAAPWEVEEQLRGHWRIWGLGDFDAEGGDTD